MKQIKTVRHFFEIRYFLILGTILISLTSFGQTKILTIKHGTQFGMCEGYCFQETTYDIENIITLKKSWKKGKSTGEEDKIDTVKNNTTKWIKITKSIDLKKLSRLPERIGCPDCADGGEEWIQVVTARKTYNIHFEYNAKIESIKELLEFLRNKKQ